MVFNDLNGNGLFDQEPGVESVTIHIDLLGGGGQRATTSTDQNGEWQVNNLTAGVSYVISVELPNGFMATTPVGLSTAIVNLPDGQSINGPIVGLTTQGNPANAGSIHGRVYHDINNDGDFNSGDLGRANQSVFIDLNNNNAVDTMEPAAVTLSDGTYSFLALPDATYEVSQLIQPPWTFTEPVGGDSINVVVQNGGSVTNVDFGNTGGSVSGGIGGTLWNDVDGDGTINNGELFVANRTVYLDIDASGDLSAGDVTTSTDGNGSYSFGGLQAGSYTVRQLLPNGWQQTHPTNNAGRIISLAAGEVVSNVLFGSREQPGGGGDLTVNIGDNAARTVVFTDVDGTKVSVSLKQANGQLAFSGTNLATQVNGRKTTVTGQDIHLLRIDISQTSSSGNLTIRPQGGNGRVDVGHISAAGPLKAIKAAKTDIENGASLGELRSLILGNLTGDQTISIGGNSQSRPLKISFGNVNGLQLNTSAAISSLSVLDWSDQDPLDNPDTISANSIKNLRSQGNFAAHVQVSGAGDTTDAIGRARIGGTLGSGDASNPALWLLNGALTTLTAGTATGWSANVAGPIRTFSVVGGDADNITVAAQAFGNVKFSDHVINTVLLAGAHLGDDGKLGGTGSAEDTFGTGNIRQFRVGGRVEDIIVAAGLDPGDGVLNNSGDLTIGGPDSYFGTIRIDDGIAGNSRFFAAEFQKTVIVSRQKIDVFQNSTFVAGLVNVSLSSTAAGPGQILEISGTGIDPSAETDVIFTDSQGNEIRTGTLPGSVTTNSLQATIPVFVDPTSGNIGPGTYSVSVDQGNNVLMVGPEAGLQVSDLAETGVPAGTLTLTMFDELDNALLLGLEHWQLIEALSDGGVDTTELQEAIREMRGLLSEQQSQMIQLANGQIDSILLGEVAGNEVSLRIEDLEILDKLYFNFLLPEIAHGSQSSSPQAFQSPTNCPANAYEPCYRDKFNPDLSDSFIDFFDEFSFWSGLGKSAIGTVFTTIVGAAAPGPVFYAVTVAPAVMNWAVVTAASPFIELSLGRPVTPADVQPGLDFLGKGTKSYVDGRVRTLAINLLGAKLGLNKQMTDYLNKYVSAGIKLTKVLDPDAAENLSVTTQAFNLASTIHNNLDAAISQIEAQTGVSRETALLAMLLSVNGNPDGILDLADAILRANALDGGGAGVTVTPLGGLTTGENGDSDTFTIVLDSQPAADVTIPLLSNDNSEGTTDLASVVFTPTNWNIPQVVTVVGVDDDVDDGNVPFAVLTGGAISQDPNYSGFDVNDVQAINNDDDTASVDVSPTSGLVTTERGGKATFDVVLTSRPFDDVTISVSSSNTAEGTVSTNSLVFTSANWDQPQEVTVTGVDDDAIDGDVVYTILIGPITTVDPHYIGLDPSDVTVTNENDDQLQNGQVLVIVVGNGYVTDSLGRIDTRTGDNVGDYGSNEFPFLIASSNAVQWIGGGCFSNPCPLIPNDFADGLVVTAVFPNFSTESGGEAMATASALGLFWSQDSPPFFDGLLTDEEDNRFPDHGSTDDDLR